MNRVGLIGCGWIVEKVYLPILRGMKDIKIAAVFDTDSHCGQRLQREYEIPCVTGNIDDFLSAGFDAALVATPNYTHTFYSDLMLKAGKHVLCEKPVAFTRKEIQRTIDMANQNKKVYLPALVSRFRTDILEVGKLAGQIGEIREVSVKWVRKSGIPKPGSWITNKQAAGGGVLIDIGTHVIDIGLMFLSDKQVKSVYMDVGMNPDAIHEEAQWNKARGCQMLPVDVETSAVGKVVFMNEAVLRFDVSWSSDVEEDVTSIHLTGTTGTVNINTLFGFSVNYKRESIIVDYKINEKLKNKMVYPLSHHFSFDAFAAMIRYFINCIDGGPMTSLLPEDGVYVVNVIEELYRSVGLSWEKL